MSISREELLKKILFVCTNQTDKKVFVSTVVEYVGKFMQADRCFWIAHDRTGTLNMNVEPYAEYRSSEDIYSHTNIKLERKTTTFVSKAIDKKISVVENIHEIALPEITRDMLIDTLSVKSYLIFPLYFNEQAFGSMVLHFVKDFRKFTEDEIELLKMIANCLSIALAENELFERLKESSSRESSILDMLSFGVYLMDEKENFIAVNDNFAKIFHKTKSELKGQNAASILHSEKYKEEYQKVKEGQAVVYEGEVNFSSNETQKKIYEITISPTYGVGNVFKGSVGTLLDITKRKEVERMEEEFISTVSHELRTPLTSINGTLDLLLSGLLRATPEKEQEMLKVARSNGERLLLLINDILDLNKLKAGKMVFHFADENIVELVELSLKQNASYAEKYNIKFNLIKDIEKATVNVDKTRLIQVFSNLLSNAAKFSENAEAVDIKIERINNKIKVSVTNYGTTISAEYKSKIFQKFSQEDSSDQRKKGGTGLGLNISKTIMTKLNGLIDFVSENNVTTFFIELDEVV